MARKSITELLIDRARDYIEKKGLARRGEKWLVGVSGGPDSVCLLHILCQLRDQLGLSLHAVHLNHGLRGAEAEADASYVAGLARSLGVPLSSGKKDTLAFRKQCRCSLEEAAREVRFLYFAGEAAAQQAAAVALAHTLDDQAETVLLHLLRGTGTWGLRGMVPRERWHSRLTGAGITVTRPLLEFRRSETEAYCLSHNLAPRFDASNFSGRFLRNRVRAELLPAMETFNPRIREALGRAARLISEEQDALQALVSPMVARLIGSAGQTVTVDLKGLLSQPAGLQGYLLRCAWKMLRGDLRDLEAQHVEQMKLLLGRGAGGMLNLPGGVVYRRDYHRVVLDAGPQGVAPPFPARQELAIPGETTALGYRFSLRLQSPADVNLHQVDPCRVHLDAAQSGRELFVRKRLEGDRFQPLGMNEEKRLQDFMVDAHIPREMRSALPLVCSPRHILWVVGHRIDHRVRVTEATPEVLTIEVERIDSRFKI